MTDNKGNKRVAMELPRPHSNTPLAHQSASNVNGRYLQSPGDYSESSNVRKSSAATAGCRRKAMQVGPATPKQLHDRVLRSPTAGMSASGGVLKRSRQAERRQQERSQGTGTITLHSNAVKKEN